MATIYNEGPFNNVKIPRRIDIRDKEKITREIGEYMLNRTGQMFKWEGLPDTIPQYMLERYLQCNGNCAIIHTHGNLYAVTGSLSGEPDAYYRPRNYIVANPYLNITKTYTIDDDCALILNDHRMLGLLPIINKYATLQAENELSLYITDVVTRMMSLITAGNDGDREAARLYLNDLEAGKLGAVMTSNFMQEINVQPYAGASGATIMGQLIEYEQYLKASMYNELGLDANYNMKRESLTTTESQMNDDALYPLIDDMLECRQKAAEKINEIFGTNITVDKASTWHTLDVERDTALDYLENNDGDAENSDGITEESEKPRNKEEATEDATN